MQHQSMIPRRPPGCLPRDARPLTTGGIGAESPSEEASRLGRALELSGGRLLAGAGLSRAARARRQALALLRALDDVTAEAGGRIYFAKDNTLTPAQTQRMYRAEALEQSHALKQQYDPQGLLTTDLYQRAIAPLFRK